jgi:SAM-dependent methyltransferase
MNEESSLNSIDKTRVYPSIFSPRYLVLSRFRKILLRILETDLPKNKEVHLIDFGCGDMPYKGLINPLVKDYWGVDLSLNPKADYHIDFDSKTQLPDACTDFILSTYVLEHVDSPGGYLAEAHRLLKPGGKMVLSTHGVWLYHPTPNDYWRWTSSGLKKEIQDQGFEIIQFEGILGLCGTGLHLFQDSILFKLPKILVAPWSFIMQGLIFLFDKIHSQDQRNRDGAMYVVLARKV